MASPFLQSEAVKPALHGRKNGAATSTLPSPVGLLAAAARFPHPCAVTPLAAGVRSFHARASWASVAPAPRFVRFRLHVSPPLARRHAVCSGCVCRSRASRSGKRRAGALPPEAASLRRPAAMLFVPPRLETLVFLPPATPLR